jgi:hypothetical protein
VQTQPSLPKIVYSLGISLMDGELYDVPHRVAAVTFHRTGQCYYCTIILGNIPDYCSFLEIRLTIFLSYMRKESKRFANADDLNYA